ncbi:MAG TPA: LapA family protein [Candidatus Dormibacteraeota bacterium]|nr:LapA family protein [Candidatus Dormibacteraeota bacterium]
MPDLGHLWQRFLQLLALVLGLAVGVGATVFGYSNTATVSVGFATWHASGVPLWTVALVPLGALFVLGMLYHWWASLTHFTENIGHRRRVHELEEEVGRLKSHLDQVLEMPDHAATPAKATKPVELVEPPRLEPVASDGAGQKAEPVAVSADGETEGPAPEPTDDANSKA